MPGTSQEKDIVKQECKICYHEVKREYGCYCCLKQDCSYIVHVTCATEDEDLYYIVDSENQDEPIESSIGCSITCVIEVNECGEATKINHFSHEHYLILEDKIEEDDDKHCDGCMLSILDSFYYCLQCDFLFPKTCAELPMKKYYWFNLHLQNLKSNRIF
ncbi:Uncharacterized protein TCM_043340 [Theobroma cacao]|uniref:DC1 domain-containing protein n=1 Tax=Theobroma cacao TaxID=3641 RepID=A0A061FQ87_THECC|nr:Uncharacterized protein TCM_043340 [Theobroma cacao]